jgi:hypothetical protein
MLSAMVPRSKSVGANTVRRTDGRSADQFFDEIAFEITLDRAGRRFGT